MARARQLATDAALNLGGTTSNRGTHLVHPARAANWAAPFYREQDLIDALLADSLANQFRVFLTEQDDGSATIEDALGVSPGVCTLDASDFSYAGSTAAVTGLSADDTYYIYAHDDSGLTIAANTDATGWPGGTHLKLATVTKAAGVLGTPDRSVFFRQLLSV